MSRSAQVNRKGEKPASNPHADAEAARREALRRKKLEDRAPTEADRPPVSVLPGPKPYIHEGQLDLTALLTYWP